MNDLRRERLFALVDLLGQCAEPHGVAARLMAQLLGTVDELRREMGELLDDMVTLARWDRHELPEADVAAVRCDLHEMGQLRQRLELDCLFCAETRQRCGRYAVPLLAVALVTVWNRVEVATEWLESADELRVRIDALLRLAAAR